MGQYFHVDRKCGDLKPGYILQLQAIQPHWSRKADELNASYPQGVSYFGATYLCEHVQDKPHLANRETLFERIRREKYPNRPSRFASLFACPSLDEARAFRAEIRMDARIWRVECAEVFTADMQWANYQPRSPEKFPIVEWSTIADKYWMGLRTAKPLLECLLTPPVVIVECVPS